jgi:hypothetical protein
VFLTSGMLSNNAAATAVIEEKICSTWGEPEKKGHFRISHKGVPP